MESSLLKRFIIAGAFLVFLPAAVLAVPQVINYQGRLTDGAGVPVTGDRGMVFALYTSATSDTPLWAESRTVPIADGTFSVELGSLTPIPSSLFGDDSLYLGVTVGTDAEMAPRQRITSVGYAYRAADADNAENAVHAGVADFASSALNANSASNAANASEAAHAISADDADMLDGLHAADLDARYVDAAGDSMIGPLTVLAPDDAAGVFHVNNAGSPSPAVVSITDGIGNAGYFAAYNPTNADSVINAETYGTGKAGYFFINNAANSAPALYAATSGTGPAGEFNGRVEVYGPVSASSFTGDGSGLTNIYPDPHTHDGTDVTSAVAEAVHAVSADNAANATSATNATNAVNATNATNATNAANADLLDSMHAADIIDAAADEVRTPISSVPFTISTPGSYYLTGDLTYALTGGAAITLNVDNVTIDLMGYSLIGPGKTSGSNYGIYMSNRKNVEIRNGTVRDFGSNGVIDIGTNAQGHRAVDVRAVGNGGSGIYLYGSGHLIKDCSASNNAQIGLYGYMFCTITGNTSYSNTSHGIYTSNGGTITGNTVAYNDANGIQGLYGCLITGNTVNNNNDNAVPENTEGGIKVSMGCVVKDNTVRNNGGNGIYVTDADNVIEENLVTVSTNGIYFNATGNFYDNNRASGNNINYGGSLPTGAGDGGGNVSF